MISAPTALRFGTRGSDLALWQTQHVMALLNEAVPGLSMEYEVIKTHGDEVLDTPLPLIGGKGVFTAELEAALYDRRIDFAVHSLKDLPTDQPANLVIGAIPPRANPADVLVSRQGYTIDSLPEGARIGTSSYRRASQLLHVRPDLKIIGLRGNVNTRVRKALDTQGTYDAIVLAYAGIERLGYTDLVSQILSFETMLPAPGQGAIAVQTRGEAGLLELLSGIHHGPTALAVHAERAFLAGLGGGCAVPVAARAYSHDTQLVLRGRVNSHDGTEQVDVGISTYASDMQSAQAIGKELAQTAREKGALRLMEKRL